VASRLYRTTRPLYLQVTRALDQLGVATLGSPTTAILIALYVTGLVLLDARPTQTRVTRLLPGRCHDALNRLLRTTPLSTRRLMGLLVAWIRRREPAATCAWTTWWSRRRSPGGCRGRGGPTRSPRSARSTACTSWWCCGAAPMAASGSRSRFGCGGPSGPARRPPPDQAAAGRGHAHRAGRGPAALQLPGHGHPLHRRVVHPPGRAAGDLLGRDAAAAHHGPLGWSAAAGRRACRAAAPLVAATAWPARRRGHRLCAQLRQAPVGRDQKPSRQLRVPGHR
jgi:hypothetical protein